jgi:hypothetical protein
VAAPEQIERGSRDDETTTRLDDSRDLLHHISVVAHVLQHVERGDEIEAAGLKRNRGHIGACQTEARCPCVCKTAWCQVETERRSIRPKQRGEVMARSAATIQKVQIAPTTSHLRNRRCHKPTESSKPEMRRLDAAGQVEEIVHRSARRLLFS